MGWDTSTGLLADIHEAHGRLKSGTSDAVIAHAEARLLATATKLLATQLDHAKATKRLREGSDVLPAFKVEKLG